MAKRGHSLKRGDLPARASLPPPSKSICRPLPVAYRKHWNAQVTRDHVFVFYEQNFRSSFDDPRDEVDGSGHRRPRLSREAFRLPARRGLAERPERAGAAAWRPGRADERAQLHERLIVVAR